MISMLIKFTLGFCLSFCILSVEFGNETLFKHVSKLTAPITKKLNDKIKKNINSSLAKSKKLFNNSEPKYIQDKPIKSKRSATARALKKENKIILEEMRIEERRQLDELISN